MGTEKKEKMQLANLSEGFKSFIKLAAGAIILGIFMVAVFDWPREVVLLLIAVTLSVYEIGYTASRAAYMDGQFKYLRKAVESAVPTSETHTFDPGDPTCKSCPYKTECEASTKAKETPNGNNKLVA